MVSRSQENLSWKGEETSCCEWAEVGKGPDFLWNKQEELLFPGDGPALESVSGLGSGWAELMQGRARTPGLLLDTSSCWKAAWLHNGRGGIYFTISWAFLSVAVWKCIVKYTLHSTGFICRVVWLFCTLWRCWLGKIKEGKRVLRILKSIPAMEVHIRIGGYFCVKTIFSPGSI